MAFALDLVVRGGSAARQALVALKDGVLGVAGAERKLAQDTAHAASAQEKLAAAARKAHTELKAAASAMRSQAVATGVNPLTGGRTTSVGMGAIEGIRRAQLLYGIQRSGYAGYEELARRKEAEAGGGGGGSSGLGRIGKRIGGIFGPAGGKVGEAIGMSPGLGALALGAVAASLALSEFGKAVDRAKEEIKRVAEIRSELRDAIREAFKSADAAALSEAKSNKGAIASLVGSGKLEAGQAAAKGLGADGLQAAGVLNQGKLLDNPKVVAAMHAAVATGQITALQFATTLRGHRGLIAGGSSDSIGKSVLALNGSPNVDVAAAGKAFGSSRYGQAFAKVDAAEEQRRGAALGRFAAGGTEGSIRDDAARIANPEAAARLDLKRKLDEQQEVLNSIAENQSAVVKLWEAIVNRGDSASNTALRTMRQTSAAVETP